MFLSWILRASRQAQWTGINCSTMPSLLQNNLEVLLSLLLCDNETVFGQVRVVSQCYERISHELEIVLSSVDQFQ